MNVKIKDYLKGENMKKPDHISHSAIQTGKCLLKYKHLVLLEDVKDERVEMDIGKLKHEIIYEYSRQCIKQKLESDFELMDKLVDKMFKESKLSMDYYENVRQCCINFGEKGFRYESMLDFEKHDTITIGQDKSGKDIKVEFVIDRIDAWDSKDGATLGVLDYKSNKNVLTKADVNNHPQLKLYQYIACRYLYPKGFYMSRKGIYYLEYNFTRWGGPAQSMGDLADQFDNTEHFLILQWDRLINTDDDKYLPERGDHCFEYGGCPVMLKCKCPLWTGEEMNNWKGEHTIKDKTRLVRILDHERKMALDELKTLVGDKEYEVDGYKVGYQGKESYKYDFVKMTEYFQENHVILEPESISFGKTEVDKVLKKHHGVKVTQLPDEDLKPIEDCRIQTLSKSFKY